MNELTAKQARILEAMLGHDQLYGHPCSLATLARWFRFTKNAGRDHLLALVKKGYLTNAPRQAHAFRLTQQARDWFQAGTRPIHFPSGCYATVDTLGGQDGHDTDAA